MIIGISGKMGSGKDTVGKLIQELRPQYKFSNKKFAAKVKQCASLILNVPIEEFENQQFKTKFLSPEWCYDKVYLDEESKVIEYHKEDMSIRTFLQLFSTDACRNNVHENFWVNALFADYKDDDNWIITDVRFLNEVYKIGEKFNSFTVRVNRDGLEKPYKEHRSEKELDNYDFHYVIDNNGTLEELREKVEALLKWWEI